MTFYTRGASRPDSWFVKEFGALPQAQSWNSLMDGIAGSIKSQGGQVRPDSKQSYTTHRVENNKYCSPML